MNIALIDLISGLSKAMDMISPTVVNHHMGVGFVAARMGCQLGLDAALQRDLLIAGLLHDVGAFSLSGRLDALQFETDATVHAEVGARLVRHMPGFGRVSELIKYHHTSYAEWQQHPEDFAPECNILCLADRFDVLIGRNLPLKPQVESILRRLQQGAGERFSKDYYDALRTLAEDSGFIAAAEKPEQHLFTCSPERLESEKLGLDSLLRFSRLFSQVIDFRSRFTATHSSGVAEVSVALAKATGEFSAKELNLLRVSGDLHDMGKLSVPSELLEKPAKLSDDEFACVKGHALQTHTILRSIAGLETVADWAGLHHERLDGRGYPYGYSDAELSLGSRIMAVADVFTAITEDRPYRKGMDKRKALEVMAGMAGDHALDTHLVALLVDRFDEINDARIQAQLAALEDFRDFYGDDLPLHRF